MAGKGGNRHGPVRAFFRALYAEMAFSKESLRLNGQGANLSKTVEQVPVLAGVTITPGGA